MNTSSSTFRTAEPDLTKLLEQVHAGELQLPDFQRGWVWDDDHIRSAWLHFENGRLVYTAGFELVRTSK